MAARKASKTSFVNGYANMPHRGGWRDGLVGLDAQSDHLSADRLADVLGTPRSTSPKSAPMRLSCGGSQQTSVPQPSRPPCVLGKKLDRSVPVVPTPAISAPTVSKPGRHRRPTSPKLIVWGFAFTSRRLAL